MEHLDRENKDKMAMLQSELEHARSDIELLKAERMAIANYEGRSAEVSLEQIRGERLQEALIKIDNLNRDHRADRLALEMSIRNLTEFNIDQKATIEALKRHNDELSQELAQRTVLFQARMRAENQSLRVQQTTIGTQEAEIIRLQAQVEQLNNQLQIAHREHTEVSIQLRETVTAKTHLETELSAVQEQKAVLDEEYQIQSQTLRSLELTNEALRGADQVDLEQSFAAQVQRLQREAASREEALRRELNDARQRLTLEAEERRRCIDEMQRLESELSQRDELMQSFQQGGLPYLAAGARDVAGEAMEPSSQASLTRRHQPQPRQSWQSGRHPDDSESVLSNITDDPPAAEADSEVLRSSLTDAQNVLRNAQSHSPTGRGGAGGRYGGAGDAALRRSIDSMLSQGTGTATGTEDGSAWLHALVGDDRVRESVQGSQVLHRHDQHRQSQDRTGIAFDAHSDDPSHLPAEAAVLFDSFELLADRLQYQVPPDMPNTANYLMNELLNAHVIEGLTVEQVQVLYAPFEIMVERLETAVVRRLHQLPPPEEQVRDNVAAAGTGTPSGQQVGASRHQVTPPTNASQPQHVHHDVSPHTPPLIASAGLQQELQHWRHTATNLQKQLEAAHLQIQQLHQQPPQPPQPLPQQMPLCPLCAHRQQREEVLVHQRQRVETDLRNLLAGKTEEVQLLLEQVDHLRAEVQEQMAQAELNRDIGRHEAAQGYEDRITALLEQVASLSEQCAALERSAAVEKDRAEEAELRAQEAAAVAPVVPSAAGVVSMDSYMQTETAAAVTTSDQSSQVLAPTCTETAMQTTSSGPAVEAGTQANSSAVTVDVVVQATPQPEETPSSDGADLVPVALVAELTQQLHRLQATHALLVEEHHAVVQQREAARVLQNAAESSSAQLAAQVSSLQAEVQRLTVSLQAARSATEGTNTEAATALEQRAHEVVALRHELQAVHQEKDDLRVRLEGEIRSLSAQQARIEVEHATEVHALRAQVALAAVPVPTVVTLTEAGAGEGDQLRDLGHQLVEATAQLHQQQRLCELLQLRIQTQDAHCAELERTKTDLQHQLQDALRRLQEHQQYLQEQRDLLQQQQQRQTVLLTSATQTHVAVRSTGTNDPSFDLSPPAAAAAAAAATTTGPAPAPPSAADHQSAAQAPHAPLQMVLPREFLALTESLQFQMEAVKNISAVVVENMRERATREEAEPAESEMLRLRSSLDAKISLVNDQITRLREQDLQRQQMQHLNSVGVLQAEHVATVERLQGQIGELRGEVSRLDRVNRDLYRDNQALLQHQHHLEQQLQHRGGGRGHGEEKDGDSVVVDKDTYDTQVHQFVQQSAIIEKKNTEIAELTEKLALLNVETRRLRDKYRLKLKRQADNLASEKKAIVDWVHVECQRVAAEFADLLKQNKEDVARQYAQDFQAYMDGQGMGQGAYSGDGERHSEDRREQSGHHTYTETTSAHSAHQHHHLHQAGEVRSEHRRDERSEYDERHYQERYDALLRTSQSSLPGSGAEGRAPPPRTITESPPRSDPRRSAHSTGARGPLPPPLPPTPGTAVRFTPTVPPTPPPPPTTTAAVHEVEVLKAHLMRPEQVKEFMRNSETTLSTGRSTSFTEHKTASTSSRHQPSRDRDPSAQPSYAYPTQAYTTRQRTAQVEASLPQQAIHPPYSAGDIAPGRSRSNQRTKSNDGREGGRSRSRSPAVKSPPVRLRTEGSHRSGGSGSGSQGVAFTRERNRDRSAERPRSRPRGEGRSVRPGTAIDRPDHNHNQQQQRQQVGQGDHQPQDLIEGELSRSLREEDYEEFLAERRHQQGGQGAGQKYPTFQSMLQEENNRRRR